MGDESREWTIGYQEKEGRGMGGRREGGEKVRGRVDSVARKEGMGGEGDKVKGGKNRRQ